MWSDIPISSEFSTSIVIHTAKGFSIVNEADFFFFEFHCFFYDPMDISNLISDDSTLSKSGLYIWKFLAM